MPPSAAFSAWLVLFVLALAAPTSAESSANALATVAGGGAAASHGHGDGLRRATARLLVVYVAGRDEMSRSRVVGVRKLWSGMQREYPGWSVRCLLAYGGQISCCG